MIEIKTPSRICLFGEHQDYLGLNVIASAIDLHFKAKAEKRNDSLVNIKIRDKSISELGEENLSNLYESYEIDLNSPIIYENKRDYFKSAINVLRKNGIEPVGCNIILDSTIPIGKGMCSSTTMVLAYISALTAVVRPELLSNKKLMADLAWKAEVEEFSEPGGKMDHYASAFGGLVSIDFSKEEAVPEKLDANLSGVFILIDSKEQKDTIKVLSDSKYPTLEALRYLKQYGINSIRDFVEDKNAARYLNKLDEFHLNRVVGNINNYVLYLEAYNMFKSGNIDDEKLGYLLNEHQTNLREKLRISTAKIDMLLKLAIKNGAYGGKFNGSGGGGCMYVYSARDKANDIVEAVKKAGYPVAILNQSAGLTFTNSEEN